MLNMMGRELLDLEGEITLEMRIYSNEDETIPNVPTIETTSRSLFECGPLSATVTISLLSLF